MTKNLGTSATRFRIMAFTDSLPTITVYSNDGN
jgi:hypothetical protein